MSACRSSGVMTPKESATPRHAGDAGERLVDLLLERVREAGSPATVSTIVERDDAVRDLDVANHVELGDRPLELRVDHLVERLQDRVAFRLHQGSTVAKIGA